MGVRDLATESGDEDHFLKHSSPCILDSRRAQVKAPFQTKPDTSHRAYSDGLTASTKCHATVFWAQYDSDEVIDRADAILKIMMSAAIDSSQKSGA